VRHFKVWLLDTAWPTDPGVSIRIGYRLEIELPIRVESPYF
jgi:hypothetical protein